MTDATIKLVRERCAELDLRLDGIAKLTSDLIARTAGAELQLANVRKDLAAGNVSVTLLGTRLDHIQDRLDRIEHRLNQLLTHLQ